MLRQTNGACHQRAVNIAQHGSGCARKSRDVSALTPPTQLINRGGSSPSKQLSTSSRWSRKQAKEQHAGWRVLELLSRLGFLWLDDVELLAHVDTVEELTDILPLHRRRLLDARGCVVKAKHNNDGRGGSRAHGAERGGSRKPKRQSARITQQWVYRVRTHGKPRGAITLQWAHNHHGKLDTAVCGLKSYNGTVVADAQVLMRRMTPCRVNQQAA